MLPIAAQGGLQQPPGVVDVLPPLPGLWQGFFFLGEKTWPLQFLAGFVVDVGPATRQFWTE